MYARWRVLLLAAAFLCAVTTPGSSVTLGKPVALLWNYTAPLPSGVTVTSFVVQLCQAVPDCFTGCTPVDVYTVSPALVQANIALTDLNVVPGASYRYQVVAVGTEAGVGVRTVPSNQICVYVVSKKRGSPTPIAP